MELVIVMNILRRILQLPSGETPRVGQCGVMARKTAAFPIGKSRQIQLWQVLRMDRHSRVLSVHDRPCTIAAGQEITPDMPGAKRPGLGIPPILREKVVCCTALWGIEAYEWITWDMV
jgi:hypothetical protein